MLPASAVFPNHQRADYILVAIANAGRASVIRSLALEFCPDIVMVRDGQDAIQHMDRVGPPRLIITELSLPRVDGFAVLRHLRHTTPVTRAAALVVSPHESFRNAARQLADSLGISKILPLDIDRPPLRRAIAALIESEEGMVAIAPRAVSQPAPHQAEEPLPLEDRINRALFELTQQFEVPMAAAYLQIGDERRIAAYVAALDPAKSINWASISELLPQAMASSDPLVIPDLENHPLFGQVSGTSAVRGFAGAPLVASGETTSGALGLFDTKPLALTASDIDAFAAYTREVARHLAQHLGPSPERTAESLDRDFEALEQLAATDPLTGLANRRGCEKSIASEISRAERERKPLSCILLDIDRFKQVNDTLGHHAGDQVLRELSAMLRQAVRAYDIVARWGGEEFLLVLPGADLEAARSLAERIRIGVQKLPTSAFGGLTISAGVAEFDAHYDFEATLRLADRRLYEAKSGGRNTVV